MQIYNYNDNGIYVGSSQARPNPGKPFSFLIPRKATTISPPSIGENESARFNGTSWETLVDFRGYSAWLKSTAEHKIIVDFGPLSNDYTLINPLDTEYPIWSIDHWVIDTVAKLVADLAEVDTWVNQERAKNFEYDGHMYYPDADSLNALITTMPYKPEDFTMNWKTADLEADGISNIYVLLDKQGIIELGMTLELRQGTAWAIGDAKKKQIKEEYNS